MGETMTNADHDTLDELLRHATPRPTPPAEVAAAVRSAVHSEWLANVRRRRRRGAVRVAVAATLLIGLFAAINMLQTPRSAVEVASIARSFGPVYVLGQHTELRETGNLATITAGQTIMTGRDAGLAVTWRDGGSLRLDQDTRVEFADAESVFLAEGRVYYDSRGATLGARVDAGDSPVLRLRTVHGDVQHIGTQYMARLDGSSLVVSVREGEVEIDGEHFDHRAGRGEQITLSGNRRPSVLSIAATGEEWQWIEETTPVIDVDGRSLYDFLAWVSRELGLQLAFVGDAETVARAAILRGSIDSRPADALRMRLASAALAWRIEEGVIYVGDEG